MYSKQEASLLRKRFWTQFGQYMRPLPGADGETVNWLNYKTGIKDLYFRMDADSKQATIAIELRHADPIQQQNYFEKFRELENLFRQTAGESWQWELHGMDEDSKLVSRISAKLKGVNIFDTADWPAIISFLKPRMQAVDNFWTLVKERFE
ncbi:MAG: DUF4268 domain-containing protein [Chitinophagaceae bacterium]